MCGGSYFGLMAAAFSRPAVSTVCSQTADKMRRTVVLGFIAVIFLLRLVW
nr:MAG TPA: hypothetical protein [Bacteriophage sp.]